MQKYLKWLGALVAVLTIAVILLAIALIDNDSNNKNLDNNTDTVTTTNDRGDSSELRVPLQVSEAPNGAIIALVPVTINGQGPYAFGLDTGASQSVVDDDIVRALNLETRGSAGQVMGIAGRVTATLIQVEDWGMEGVTLPANQIVSFDLSDPGEPGLAGLLGSDVLSEFNAVTVDYDDEVLRLESRPQ